MRDNPKMDDLKEPYAMDAPAPAAAIDGEVDQAVQDQAVQDFSLADAGIAIIGMAGRFPGAPDIAAFWDLLLAGRDSISRFRPDELEDSFDASVRNDPAFVAARPILEGIEDFDAAFFDMNPREAALADPQQRIFLECAWNAIEEAGYDAARLPGLVGVFGGSSLNSYLLRHVLDGGDATDRFTSEFQVGAYPELLGALHDFVATRVAYKLNLKGPAVAVQSACSTSLLAVAQACQSLATHQCDMALAGGVSVTLPQRRGYLHQDGGIASADGTCRPFDAEASGTVFGSGAAIVLLKRVDEAIADGDRIHAVIRGWSVNNDGATKAGFTAPSSEGQAACIASALAMAGFDAASVGYVECHGTGTPVGDPIEVAGLRDAFAQMADGPINAVLGSVKANVGHLDAAAGVTGLVKTALMLDRQFMPPQINFTTPNPRLDLAAAGFRIETAGGPWIGEGLRRAGVSAFGVGGTNVHLCLEEAPISSLVAGTALAPADPGRSLLAVSARSPEGLAAAAARLADRLEESASTDAPISLADAAFTLHAGRSRFDHRLAIGASTLGEAAERLRNARSDARKASARPFVVLMFPGQGSQYSGMASWLRRSDPAFRADIDRGCAIFKADAGIDLAPYFDAVHADDPGRQAELRSTALAQPALFIVEHALGLWLQRRGIRADALIGHSLGELVAACLAGIIREEDAIAFVAARGRLMQEQPGGAMVAVRAPAGEISPLLPEGADIAAINSPMMCVVSGSQGSIGTVERIAAAKGLEHQRLHTSHAFHSAMMDPVVGPLSGLVSAASLRAPTMRLMSTVTGAWLTDVEATDPAYWGRHCREPVLFGRSLDAILAAAEMDGADPILIEVGPGGALSTFARQAERRASIRAVVRLLPVPAERAHEEEGVVDALGQLWSAGVEVDLSPFAPRTGRRVALPTYPFQRRRHWIERRPRGEPDHAIAAADRAAPTLANPSPADMQAASMSQVADMKRTDLPIFDIDAAIAERLASLLEELSGERPGEGDRRTPFLSLGFDSLLLGQLAQRLNKEFGTKISFRDLMRDAATIDALAARIIAAAPPERLPKPAPVLATPVIATMATAPAAAASVAVATSAGTAAAPAGLGGRGSLDAIVREQLAVMQQVFAAQLAPFGGGAAAPPPAPTPTAATPEAAMIEEAPGTPSAAEAELPSRFRMYRPSGGAADDGLSDAQLGFISGLAAAYNARTPLSKAKAEAFRSVLADPRSASGFRKTWKELIYPIVCDRAKGSRIVDIDGNSYIDMVNGYGQTAFGHAPDFIVEAVRAQLERGFAIGPQSPLAGEVAQRIADLTGNERVTFCNTGSEAVMAAMRVARSVTGRDRVVVFGGAYHGQFDEVLIKGRPPRGPAGASPIASGIPAQNVGNMTVLPYADAQALDWVRAQADSLAAVIVEPVQSRHPAVQPQEFLKELRRIADSSGTALVFDEVVTGFRAHPGGMQALFGIRADLATYGKVVGGGLPIGVLAGRRRYMDALDGGHWRFGDDSEPETAPTFFAGTFVRHPLALAAAKAVLKHIEADPAPLFDIAPARAAAMAAAMNAKLAHLGLAARAEQFASWLYLDVAELGPLAGLLFPQIRLLGVHAQEGFPWFLTTAHDEADCDAVVDVFGRALDALDAGGLLERQGERQDRQGSGQPGASAPRLVHEPQLGGDPPLQAPLTEPQAEVYLAAQMGDAASCAFNESVSVTLVGALDVEALKQAMSDLVERHDALRVRMVDGGEAMRGDAPAASLPAVFDLSAEPDPEARLAAWLDEDARTPFGLATGPLTRTALFQLAATRHVLVLTAHHIICDGWSINILIRDLATFYNARAAGRAPDLEPAQSFVRHASRTPARLPAISAFWRGRFETLPAPTELPLDRPRPELKSFAGATCRRSLGRNAVDAARALAKARGVSLFAVLFCAVQAAMSRLSGQPDIVLTVPMGGQGLLDHPDLVGHCVNFLPLRAPIAPGASFEAHLMAANAHLLDAFEHQDYTFGTLVRELGVPRSPNRTPLSDIQFNLERVGEGLAFDGLRCDVRANGKAFTNFDLFFNLVERKEGIDVEVDFATDLFEEASVARFVENIGVLLLDICCRPEVRIADAEILSGVERAAIIDGAAGPTTPIAARRRIEQLFEAQCDRTPDAIAAVCGDTEMTYAELDRAANRLAHRLRRDLPAEGARIALALPRGLDLPIAILGVLKAGHAYVPLDPSQPTERLAATMRLADVAAVLARGPVPPAWREAAGTVVDLAEWDDALPTAADERRPALPDTAAAAATAYVIFTSGSTGQPKGVGIGHQAAVNFLMAMAERPGLRADRTMLAVTTIAFDIAALELLLPLVVGARTVIAEQAALGSPSALAALIDRAKVDTIQATPSLWRMLAEFGFLPTAGMKALCGGEPLPGDLARQLLSKGAELWNMYGPTEATIWCSAARILDPNAPVAIGEPIDNVELHVLDNEGQPCPFGLAGELHIGGVCLAEGYFGRRDLTEAAFVTIALPGRKAVRLYRSGDLARRAADGSLLLLGRKDQQVKIRGHRIELGEIESVLRRLPGVADAAAAVRDPGSMQASICAAFTTAPDATVSVDDLARHAAAILPDYMLPSQLSRLDALPRTANGKLDRKALLDLVQQAPLPQVPLPQVSPLQVPRLQVSHRQAPAPQVLVPQVGPEAISAQIPRSADAVSDGDAEVRATTETARAIAEVWRETLRLPDEPPSDRRLFELGADSLHIFRMAASFAKLGIAIQARHLMVNPNIRELVSLLNEAPPMQTDAKRGLSLADYRRTAKRKEADSDLAG